MATGNRDQCKGSGGGAAHRQCPILLALRARCTLQARLLLLSSAVQGSSSNAPAAAPKRRLLRGAVAAAAEAAPAADYRQRASKDVRVLVVGATGYIGKFVVRELVSRGYNVVAFARERSGIGGKQTAEDVQKDFPGAGTCLKHVGLLACLLCSLAWQGRLGRWD